MLFKLKRGSHLDAKGKVYKKGATIESSRDLVKIFGKVKFERDHAAEQRTGVPVIDKKPAIPSPVVKTEKSKKVEEPKNTDTVKESSKYGKDVTSNFPTADDVEVDVFEKAKWYTVIDRADGEVLNTKKLRKKSVEPFLEQYLEEEDED